MHKSFALLFVDCTDLYICAVRTRTSINVSPEKRKVMVRFKVVGRANPLDRNAPKKFYPSLIATEDVTFEDLAEEVSDSSTLNAIDCRAVLYAMEKYMVRHLRSGRCIRFGDVGTFRLSATSTGADTEAEVSAGQILRTRVLFRPSAALKRSIRQLQYRKQTAPGQVPSEETPEQTP